MLAGSGSGGHITPLLAVAKEIKKMDQNARLIYIGEKNGKYHSFITDSKIFDSEHYIYSGKFRRYHGESWAVRLVDFKTNFLNIRDLIKISIGIVQGTFLLKKINADVVFLKGGSVCIPTGIGAKYAKIPVVTHDSDSVPGLSNIIGGRNAVMHATAMPVENYSYPKEKTIQVGLPISENYREYTDSEVRFLKEKMGLKPESRVILVTGGSGGAKRLNEWCREAFHSLIEKQKDLFVIFITGQGKGFESGDNRVKVVEFTTELFHYNAIADVVIARAGATTLNELACQKKAVVVVPSPDLTGGHQLKNAKVYAKKNAIILVQESDIKKDIKVLTKTVDNLLNDESKRKLLAENLNKTLPAVPAAETLAEIIIKNKKT